MRIKDLRQGIAPEPLLHQQHQAVEALAQTEPQPPRAHSFSG